MSKSNRPGKSTPSEQVAEGSRDNRQDDPDEVVQRVAFRLVEAGADKPNRRRLKLVLFLLALMAVGVGALFWFWPSE